MKPNHIDYAEFQAEHQLDMDQHYMRHSSEYIVPNPDLVKVRYIIQLKYIDKEGEDPPSDEEDSD